MPSLLNSSSISTSRPASSIFVRFSEFPAGGVPGVPVVDGRPARGCAGVVQAVVAEHDDADQLAVAVWKGRCRCWTSCSSWPSGSRPPAASAGRPRQPSSMVYLNLSSPGHVLRVLTAVCSPLYRTRRRPPGGGAGPRPTARPPRTTRLSFTTGRSFAVPVTVTVRLGAIQSIHRLES